MLDSGTALFLDDILVYSCTVKEHLKLLEKVLVHLPQYKFYCKLKKYSLLRNSTMFLSFHITPKGTHNSYSKVWSLNERLVPTIVK